MSVNETDMTYPKCAPGKGINFPSEKNYWKKFEKNNLTIALNVLYAKKDKIYPAYVSKHNSNRE